MKNFRLGHIFCRCSIRMHCKGKAIRMYASTPSRKNCPNCGRERKVVI